MKRFAGWFRFAVGTALSLGALTSGCGGPDDTSTASQGGTPAEPNRQGVVGAWKFVDPSDQTIYRIAFNQDGSVMWATPYDRYTGTYVLQGTTMGLDVVRQEDKEHDRIVSTFHVGLDGLALQAALPVAAHTGVVGKWELRYSEQAQDPNGNWPTAKARIDSYDFHHDGTLTWIHAEPTPKPPRAGRYSKTGNQIDVRFDGEDPLSFVILEDTALVKVSDVYARE
jgi:hypothetical protein